MALSHQAVLWKASSFRLLKNLNPPLWETAQKNASVSLE